MRSHAFAALLILGTMATGLPVIATPRAADDDVFLGRWDITATGSPSGLPRNCWLEIKRENGVLKARFNQGGGAVFDLPVVSIEHGELKFQYPQWKTKSPQVWQGVMKGVRLVGTAHVDGETLSWTGERGPAWPATSPQRKPGKPIDLFNGKDTSNWLCQDPRRPMGWSVKDGILMNEGKEANNIYTRQKFNDFKLDVEFNVDPQSNSGVYLRGRYEIQILDDVNRPLDVHSQGALYGFIVPPVKASKPAGEWQTYQITLVANRVTVILNGTKIIDNAEVPGITGGALDAHEKEPGPILLQGDHGRVQIRKVRLTPLI
jgi:3-keto-disaccharide hydrolase